ncbi:MAG: hypothetical protein KF789_11370 [Bdellovibrionaceae bacterium]|nr:hypothetical protein [Pseudobdellovibrionaceae bacterium]
MLRLVFFLLPILLTDFVNAGCFREHLREAIALNTARSSLYSSLTDGASRSVSKLMIETEKMMLSGSYLVDVDHMALRYEKAGIRVTCDSYVSMSLVPRFQKRFAEGPVPAAKNYDLRSLRIGKRLSSAFASQDDAKILSESLQILDQMKREPRLYCMTRHLVESVARIAALIPLHEQKTQAYGMKSPRSLHRLMIRGHLVLVERSRQIDEKAKPLNMAGIPLVCQDVPPIELPEKIH